MPGFDPFDELVAAMISCDASHFHQWLPLKRLNSCQLRPDGLSFSNGFAGSFFGSAQLRLNLPALPHLGLKLFVRPCAAPRCGRAPFH